MSTRTFRRFALFAVALPFCFAAVSVVAGPAKDAGAAASEASIPSLLASWKAATKDAKPLNEQQKQRIASVAKECPVGSRLGSTLGTVRDSLATVVSCAQENAKHCPLESAEAKKALDAAARAEGLKLKEARTKLIGDLHQLASYAAGACCGADEGCCAAKQCAKETKTAVAAGGKSKSCAKEAAAGGKTCPIRVAARLGELKASWSAAQTEAGALSAEQKQKILAGFGSLAESHQAVALIPQSVMALSSGLEKLAANGREMMAWAQANPEFMGSISQEAHRAFQLQAALLDEARVVLGGVTKTMRTMNPEYAAASAAVETAQKK